MEFLAFFWTPSETFRARWPRIVTRLKGLAISMDGRGRAIDNVFIERLWWSVKYESIYRHAFDTVPLLDRGLRTYFDFYCHERPH